MCAEGQKRQMWYINNRHLCFPQTVGLADFFSNCCIFAEGRGLKGKGVCLRVNVRKSGNLWRKKRHCVWVSIFSAKNVHKREHVLCMWTSGSLWVWMWVCAKGGGLITHTDGSPAPIRLAKHLWILLTSALYFCLYIGILEFECESLITDTSALSVHLFNARVCRNAMVGSVVSYHRTAYQGKSIRTVQTLSFSS